MPPPCLIIKVEIAVLGKSAEDIADYFTQLRQTVLNMGSPFMRPVQALVSNEAMSGQKIYDPYAPMPKALGQAVGNLALVAAESVVPRTALDALYKLMTGRGGAFEAAQIVGGGLGFSVSHGFPGGPAEGERYAAEQTQNYAVRQALPDIRQQIQDGDVQGAVKRMTDLGIAPGLQRYYISQAQHPHMTQRQLHNFMRYATPEQRERLARDTVAGR